MKRGILLIACGHPYYGKMAAALAATIKVSDSNMPVHLAYAGDALNYLSETEKKLFGSLSEIPEDNYTVDGKVKWIRTKMFMYDLSPFDETIFLDVDMLWLKQSPAVLFDEFKEVEMTFCNYGEVEKYSQWANVEEVRAAYPSTGKYYSLHSELVYFKKCKNNRKLFNAAKKIYDNLKVKATTFAGAIPDELPFAIAIMQHGVVAHKEPYRPVFWMNAEPRIKHIYELAKDYIALSMGGNYNPKFTVDTYNTLTSAAYHKLGLQQPYKWKLKRSFLSERKAL